MPTLLKLKEAAARKGCSKKSIHRACEAGKVNTEFDPVNGEYQVYDDELFARWQPGESGKPAGENS
ncbi:MAG: hypothetical protein ACM3XM_09615 [Mycobacterium leprae]